MAHALDELAREARAEVEPAPGVSREPVASRQEQKESPLYQGRVWVYPKAVRGTFRRVKWAALAALLAIYWLLPWVRWDRGPGAPDQAVMIDMAGRRGYWFGIEIWPQEVYFLTGLLIMAAFGLFLATALFGRLWCGFACPQTVWTDLYMWVERRIEGDRAARIRLDKSRWNAAKVRKKLAKHGAWLAIALATGGAWILYFGNAPDVLVNVVTGQASLTAYFFIGLFTTTTYVLAGVAREQVCTYMCPWPRIQGALFDQDTLAVTYERWRGEPRGPVRKGQSFEERGDCIDCKQCVAVCPTGIDIRDGLQLECIGCALCVDACNQVMDRIGRPRNLIAYDSARNVQARAQGETPRVRPLRARTAIYVAALAIVGGLMTYGLMTRSQTDLTIQRDRSALFITLADGSVRNTYTVKVHNKTFDPQLYTLDIEGLPAAAETWVVGRSPEPLGDIRLAAEADAVAEYTLLVAVPRQELASASLDLEFAVTSEFGETVTHDTVFRGPER
ncbi:MAG: cytochrome c oxidase accessory protein CcoG [Alphaproteobacteria bacterium]|jgi:cytochrome c oxidase accessory protein FixG|nr:cytochrome c oxidase accessory protein CcoG [Alphaproteobacteria bacterium]